ncbi:MAG: protein translocase subunit SecD [Candidatus Pacebacteria bacterium]|nr:protein translocase subunit SecD [Candidatus Paceibacterota bacterium]
MMWTRLTAAFLILAGVGVGYFIYTSQAPGAQFPFRFGLDLAGGTHLVYQADTSNVDPADVSEAMDSLRDVIERRVNLFGVSEPLVQVEQGGIGSDGGQRLIVELPGVTKLEDAIGAIGQTPTLDFRLARTVGTTTMYESTGLTGQYLEGAQLQFGSGGTGLSNAPVILIRFTDEGATRFRTITEENVGEVLGIFLDNALISDPVIQEVIPTGEATITGAFKAEEAREIVRNLNFGALPVPITLVSSQSVGASLGAEALDASVWAGIFGFLFVAVFLVAWYRLPGFIAVVALLLYVVVSLALFKLIPVTLTVAGLAAFILSLGMAVDANILIFERTREELLNGKTLHDAIHEGFNRAWLSIRDSNLSSIITGVILFWIGGTAIIKGFALVFVLGVLVSMFTAITVSRTLLLAVGIGNSKTARFLFGNGIN